MSLRAFENIPKPLPVMVPCRLHNAGVTCVLVAYYSYRVVCVDTGRAMCYGPARKTERGARNAWNKQEDGQ